MFSWLNSSKPLTDSKLIDRFLHRGVENLFPSGEFLRKKLLNGEKLSMYLGIDPTSPTLHLGHVIALRKLREFQKLGHQAILLIGDFTAMVGDPTGKSSTRESLSREKVLLNSALYKEQASIFLSFSGPNPALLKYNSFWLSKMNFAEVLGLASSMTVEQMLKRDMFEERQKAGQPIFIHEFLYPLLQGYDSVAMAVDGEIGGNDQTFNMLVGRDLLKTYKKKDKFVMAVKLLTDSAGKKMGKTEGNMVTLSDSPSDMFGKIMSWDDGLIIPGLELLTDEGDEAVLSAKEELSSGKNPKKLKTLLARLVVGSVHGEKKAAEAEDSFSRAFGGGDPSSLAKEIAVKDGSMLKDLIVVSGAASSMSAAHRLVEEGAVTRMNPDVKISDAHMRISKQEDGAIFRFGKKHFVKIRLG